MNLKETLKKAGKKIILMASIILLTNLIHWLCILFLSNYCTKPGIWGLIENILSLGSPLCQFVNYVQFHLSNFYINLWITLAVGAVSFLNF